MIIELGTFRKVNFINKNKLTIPLLWNLETTFQDDCVPCEIKPRQSFKPSPAVKHSTVPFNGDTSHHLDYVPHQLEFKFARPKEVYKPTNQPTFWGSHNSLIWLPGACWWKCKHLQTSIHQSVPKCSIWKKHWIPWQFSTMGNPTTRSQESTRVCPSRRYRAITQHKPHRLCSIWGQTCCSFPSGQLLVEKITVFLPKEEAPRRKIFQHGKVVVKDLLILSRSSRSPTHLESLMVWALSDLTMRHMNWFQQSCKPVNVPFKGYIPFDDVTVYSPECAPKKQEICPA